MAVQTFTRKTVDGDVFAQAFVGKTVDGVFVGRVFGTKTVNGDLAVGEAAMLQWQDAGADRVRRQVHVGKQGAFGAKLTPAEGATFGRKITIGEPAAFGRKAVTSI